MKNIKNIFIRGLLIVLPVVITAAVLIWLVKTLELFVAPIIQWLIPGDFYLPGLGLVVGLAFIFSLGIFVEALVFRYFWRGIEALIQRTPLVRDVYSAIKDLILFVSGKKDMGDGSVVMIDFGDPPIRLMGLVTNSDLAFLNKDQDVSNRNGEKLVAVYLPMSYQVGGFTVYVPKSKLINVDLTTEKALRYTVTACMSKSSNNNSKD
ncbi:MAG: DUF502 domain-containing protein [Gammaproteobacteria bacterium]|nr:DUF502 domain-containing protein [Gammaproteobacteria bacterium]